LVQVTVELQAAIGVHAEHRSGVPLTRYVPDVQLPHC
jgi:hypothetical protein